jgi:hypothetical protein
MIGLRAGTSSNPARGQRSARCPACGADVDRPPRGQTTVECPSCATALTVSVPIFAPPMGGPCWWGWKAPDGHVSWEATAG